MNLEQKHMNPFGVAKKGGVGISLTKKRGVHLTSVMAFNWEAPFTVKGEHEELDHHNQATNKKLDQYV
jgi:hypothetical protein